jgi:gamma-butyrobetaine dioxygenase
MTILAAEVDAGSIEVALADGRRGVFHGLALRDACPCAACRLPSGQRLFESHQTLPGITVESAALVDGGVEIRFSDGHAAFFPDSLIGDEVTAFVSGRRLRRDVRLWGSELAEGVPAGTFDEVREIPDRLRRWLVPVAELGVGLLRDVPLRDGTVAEVAELFSPVRVTNYGRVFDVTVRVDATNLADSALGLSLHTDNPYRFPAPSLQLLHCLASSAEGGETILSDGFRAVELLGAADPDGLALLATLPIRYRYADGDAELVADVPVVILDAAGEAVSLQLNNRSKGTPLGPPDLVERWYEAYFSLHRLLDDASARIVFRLEAGDLVVFDNLRVLHGRTAFTGAGARRLQGCYADRDALLSKLAVLERESRGDEQ